jgi:hypothetical protein
MASFLLETYTTARPGDVAVLVARARAAAESASAQGYEVRHVRTFLVPDDEMCFHIFDASSAKAVERMAELAELVRGRITEVVEGVVADSGDTRRSDRGGDK